MSHQVKQTIGQRYVLRREVARSANSELFEAVHGYTQRTVAIKTLCGDALRDEKTRRRLIREAQLLTAARHPAVVQVLDAGETTPGDPFVAMEMLRGRTLDGVLASRGRLAVKDAFDMASSICEALHHAHAQQFVHASLSPTSVFLFARSRDQRASVPPAGQQLVVKLLDFGLAPNPVTVAGGALGAMGYAAPELLQGKQPDQRSDVYGLGAMLYECLTGALPAAEGGASAVSAALLRCVPESFAEAVLGALAPYDDRFPNMDLFGQALRAAVPGERRPDADQPPQRRRRKPRAPYVTPVVIERSDGSLLEGNCEDISEGGMLIVATSEIEASELVQVSFALPVTGAFIKLLAIARWVRTAREGAGAIGIEFSEPSRTVVAEIADHVAALSDDPD